MRAYTTFSHLICIVVQEFGLDLDRKGGRCRLGLMLTALVGKIRVTCVATWPVENGSLMLQMMKVGMTGRCSSESLKRRETPNSMR